MSTDRAFYVLAYDIANDRRRARIAKASEAVGERVQGSVFEAYLTSGELEKLLKKTSKVMDVKFDSLRIYCLCESCKVKIKMHGTAQVTPAPGLVIV